MWTENRIFKEDMENIAQRSEIDWEKLNGQTILLTGGTGLIGYTMLCALMYGTRELQKRPHVLALVRSEAKARERMKDLLAEFPNDLELLLGDVQNIPEISGSVDYIIHGASPTASKYFVEHPVETIQTAVHGTENLLELARVKKSKGFVYMSSMEVYGQGKCDGLIDESFIGNVDPLTVRNCYPEGKRMCESLCVCYKSEYGVPTKIVRLAQTFGPGVMYDDGRVFAEFARCAVEGRDIVMLTDGLSERMYLYIADAVAAILCVLLNEHADGAYNLANERTFCNIRQLADVAIEALGNGKCKLQFAANVSAESTLKYSAHHRYELNTARIKSLGWSASYSLADMFVRMVESTWKN